MGAVPDTMVNANNPNRKPAWHGIGVIAPNLLTAAEALELSGLSWTVSLQPLYDADMNVIPDFFATTRDDTKAVLGVVGKRYALINNKDGFDFVDSILGDGSAKFETAGSLFGGKTVWMLACLPDDIKVAGDIIKPYFLLKNTHDGSGALKVLTTPVRVVCQNTLNAALGSAQRTFSVRHTRNYEDKLATARETLGVTKAYYQSFVEFAEGLARKAFSKNAFEKLMDTLLPVPTDEGRGRTNAKNEQAKLLQAYRAEDLENIRTTKLGAYNAIVDYADHDRKLVGAPDVRRDNAFARTFEGTDLKDRALALILAS